MGATLFSSLSFFSVFYRRQWQPPIRWNAKQQPPPSPVVESITVHSVPCISVRATAIHSFGYRFEPQLSSFFFFSFLSFFFFSLFSFPCFLFILSFFPSPPLPSFSAKKQQQQHQSFSFQFNFDSPSLINGASTLYLQLVLMLMLMLLLLLLAFQLFTVSLYYSLERN